MYAPDREGSATVQTQCRGSRSWRRISPSSREGFPVSLWLTPPVAGWRRTAGILTGNNRSRSRVCWQRRSRTSGAKIYSMR